jgi:DNA-binding protein YbaB
MRNIGGMMKRVQEMQEKMQEMTAEMEASRFDCSVRRRRSCGGDIWEG